MESFHRRPVLFPPVGNRAERRGLQLRVPPTGGNVQRFDPASRIVPGLIMPDPNTKPIAPMTSFVPRSRATIHSPAPPARPRVFRSFPHTRNGGSGIDEWMGANSTVDRSGSRILPVLLPDDNPLLQATHSDSNPSERPSTSTDIPLQQAFRLAIRSDSNSFRLAIRSDKHSTPTVPTGHPLRQAFQI